MNNKEITTCLPHLEKPCALVGEQPCGNPPVRKPPPLTKRLPPRILRKNESRIDAISWCNLACSLFRSLFSSFVGDGAVGAVFGLRLFTRCLSSNDIPPIIPLLFIFFLSCKMDADGGLPEVDTEFEFELLISETDE